MLQLLRASCPFPTVTEDGTLFDGLLIPQPRRCRRCKPLSCAKRLEVPQAEAHSPCEFGLSTIVTQTPYGNLLVNGVVLVGETLPLTKAFKRSLRSHRVTREAITRYEEALVACVEILSAAVDQSNAAAVAGLHDIKTAVGLVLRNAEALVPIETFEDEEKLERGDPKLTRMYKSVQLLKTRLDLASMVANPESAKYGRRRATPVYKVFHKMVRVFHEEAQKRGVVLKMSGISFNKPSARDSFETIALVLLDNATKYAAEGSTVSVVVKDVGRGCAVSVESSGHVVPAGERAKIFDRGFRCSRARSTASKGSGLGLHIATIVAEAHGFALRYEVEDVGPDQRGRNCFRFEIGRTDGPGKGVTASGEHG